ncbi:ThuA domain-containing protein [Nitratireductor sp. ZSWI3]|uniref:N,N-dimethylformamidase beta subunit family domain-containing protein n=1 Tax=Nitratireductor sp. ZSWI3 TaxID=2966359 RepID=UPI00214FEE53|nr:ThuA domain-containing protein [Nitratireductor sp. ZSWI3]MCR4268717.1 ThuA domain-containing protein [Nitratireductor sp. ZSWI3]
MHTIGNDFPDFGLTLEERRTAVLGHYYEYPGMDGGRGEIWCYTDAYAYPPGATVRLHVSSTAPTYRLDILRDGAAETAVLTREGLSAAWQDTPDQCSVSGCGWQASCEFRIAEDWPSGAYRITLTAQGRDGRPIRCHHLFIVRPAPGAKPGRILQVAATGTWTAYNTWGGSNHYQGITGPKRNQYAPRVSIERPFCRGFVVLPHEAPRVPLEIVTPPAAAPRYPHMEWAYANGYSKKYASSGWASYDSLFFRWAERSGYAVDLASQHELHFTPEILDGYDCVVFVGHDEYWSWEMRDAVDGYVERGGRAARFAGNFMWQTRLEDEGRKQVCYKYRARAEDPVYRSADPRRTSGCWEARETSRPAAQTFGLNALRGLYVGWGGCAPRGVRGFPVYRPEHWAFSGTGVYYGDLLGADGHAFGYEVDGLDYVIRGGLPEPAEGAGAPEGLEILALGVSSLKEESADIPADDQFLSDADAKFVAGTLIGNDGEEAVDAIKRGCGMIVNFPRGKGEVFHAGSCEWVAALKRGDAMVERVTANVLDRYLTR